MSAHRIFEEAAIQRLCMNYANEPDFIVPEVVRLARASSLAGERQQIEAIFQRLPESVRKDWRSRLISTEHAQHKSVWFQIMLYSWLKKVGAVVPEPELLGNRPDFLLDINGRKIAIEAKAVLIPDEQRACESWENEVFWLLNQIPEPSVAVEIKQAKLVTRIGATDLLRRVTAWLHRNPETVFQYEDEQGNHIELEVLWTLDDHSGVATIASSDAFWLDSDQFKRPLQEKAKQHRAVRKSPHPYLIALYLEDRIYTAKEIVAAWFGRDTVIVDTLTGDVVDHRLDMSGIHYFGHEIRHRSVSGTLVFRDVFDEPSKQRRLQGWFIQNPYAHKPIDPWVFPVEASFVVKSRNERRYQMAWIRSDDVGGIESTPGHRAQPISGGAV